MSDDRPGTEEIVKVATFGTIMTTLMVVGLIGNIFCFKLTRRLLWNKPSLALVLNLNMSDIIVAGVSWVGFAFQHIAIYSGISVHVIIHKVFWSILITLANVTLLTLVGLAADCFIALRWPLHYKSIATCKSVNIYITVIWIVSVVAGGSDFLVAVGKHKPKENFYGDIIRDSMRFTGSDRSGLEVLVASVTMLISNMLSFICLLSMVGMYTYILFKIRRVRIDNTLSKQGGLKSEIAAVRTTAMIFTSFLLLWLPTLTINIISIVQPDHLSRLSYLQASIIGYTADSLLMVHSIVDAFIYGIRIKKILRRHRLSRESQAGFSRANTLRRRSSDYDRTPSEYQEETNETSETMAGDYQQRRLSTTSSLHAGTTNTIDVIATISDKVTMHTEKANSLSDDSGISSPHKLSPQYQAKLHKSFCKNSQVDYEAHPEFGDSNSCRTSSVVERVSISLSQEVYAESNRIKDNEEMIIESEDRTEITVHENSSLAGDNLKVAEHDNESQKLQVPKEIKPLRSSLKMSKSQNNKLNHVSVESHVRFCLANQPMADKDNEQQKEQNFSRTTIQRTDDTNDFIADSSEIILTVENSLPTRNEQQTQKIDLKSASQELAETVSEASLTRQVESQPDKDDYPVSEDNLSNTIHSEQSFEEQVNSLDRTGNRNPETATSQQPSTSHKGNNYKNMFLHHY